MEINDAVILGLIQGITEYLPVSSSGHLEFGKAILGNKAIPEESMLFTVVLHLATAFSTLVVFRKDIFSILKGVLKFEWNEDMKFLVKIIVSMIPAVIFGLFFEEQLEQLFSGNILLVGCLLLVTAVLLYIADRAKSGILSQLSYKNTFLVGLVQAVAMLPGISRSGSTIATGVLLGFDKSKAARFSFLMVVPLILGKVAKDILSGDITYNNQNTAALGAGFIVAFICGLIACTWMLNIVKKNKLSYFAYYCAIVGIIAICLSL